MRIDCFCCKKKSGKDSKSLRTRTNQLSSQKFENIFSFLKVAVLVTVLEYCGVAVLRPCLCNVLLVGELSSSSHKTGSRCVQEGSCSSIEVWHFGMQEINVLQVDHTVKHFSKLSCAGLLSRSKNSN
jgi:hypothetical protein